IDNLVQIGHNVVIGSTCGIAALSGLGGSCEVEDFVHMAGFTGIPDGVTIGAGAKLFGRCAVDRDVEPGEELYWAPARPPMQLYRMFALMDRLPEMAKTLKRLEKQLAAQSGESEKG
ncbi:MAG: UDP-3-O-(3-hydroxymyristoyl)glucosamine N-acyltransferase, partial [Planctomycetes bacterium]|nr:UDP-3-O-(3-hydroxymyristoyl)glucosamine N-acyltransferase [Planctomycetota bacterium]